MDIIEDVRKLKHFLENQTNESDCESVDSNEIIDDCAMLKTNNIEQIIDKDTERVLMSCKNETLKTALLCNIEKRRVLNELLNKLQTYHATINKTVRDYRLNKTIEHTLKVDKIRLPRKRLGIPYFKDFDNFSSPQNEDSKKMKETNQIILSTFMQNFWTIDEQLNLARAVYKEACDIQVNELKRKNSENQFASEIKLFKNKAFIHCLADKWERNTLNETVLKERKSQLKKQLDHMLETTSGTSGKCLCLKKDYERFDDKQQILQIVSKYENIDWLKISSDPLMRRHNYTDCKLMWICYMNPKFNKTNWTEKENEWLKQIADKYDHQDWDSIAQELSTSRSPYQCCKQFYTKLCKKFRKFRWSIKEDEQLMQTIKMCRYDNRIPWPKVAFHFKTRSKYQVYDHYRHRLAPKLKKGSFSMAEDVLLLATLKLYRRNVLKAKQFFPFRTLVQLRTRLINISFDNSKPWTLEEDTRILQHVDQYGPHRWTLFQTNRTPANVRHRFMTLKRWFHLNPNDSLVNVTRRDKEYYNRRYKKRMKAIHETLPKLFKKINETKGNPQARRKLLNLNYIERLLSEIPGYIMKRNPYASKQPSRPDTSSLDKAFVNLFKCSYKKQEEEEEANISTENVKTILHVLKANLQIPSVDAIQSHPELSDTERQVLLDVLQTGDSKAEMLSNNLIPPNIESCTGFRGLTILNNMFEMHAKGVYDDKWHLYDMQLPMSRELGFQYARCQREQYLESLDLKNRKTLSEEQTLFWNRLYSLFWWPAFLTSQSTPKRTIINLDDDDDDDDNDNEDVGENNDGNKNIIMIKENFIKIEPGTSTMPEVKKMPVLNLEKMKNSLKLSMDRHAAKTNTINITDLKRKLTTKLTQNQRENKEPTEIKNTAKRRR